MVALPGQLFYSTQIPVCLWFIARDKRNGRFKERTNKTLFIDARRIGRMTDRVHRELTDADIDRVADTYHAWRGDPNAPEYRDALGFCKSASLREIADHGFALTPGRYVGIVEEEPEAEPFEQRMERLSTELMDLFSEGTRLEDTIRNSLVELGYV
jgi:type I restriction enzyme M protein